MPPSLALFLTLALIAFLFARDIRERSNVTGALWLPFFWITICGGASRFLSQWLNIFGFNVGGISVEDGSPVDAAFNFAIIVAGVCVLYRRRVRLSEFVRNNRWVTLYLAYCLLAVLWSDFPFVAFKRWFKLIGNPIMALVILTEPDLTESLTRLMKRCAYFLLPLSICFIKYFPNLGRTFDYWNGGALNTGVTTNKNLLGFDCWIIGLVLFWHLLQVLKWERSGARRNEIILCGGLLAMDLWLFHLAQSATSLMVFLLGATMMLFLGFRWVNERRVSAYLLAGIVACVFAGFGLGLFDSVIHLLGRNDTLTGRTDIWQTLWHWKINSLVGTGYESFWLGDRRQELQSLLPGLNEAHNGYLETYLNLGIAGVIVTVALLLATYGKVRRELLINFEFGRFRLAYLLGFIIYNWTEAAFRMNGFPFFIFFLIAIDYPARQAEPALEFSEIEVGESELIPVEAVQSL